MLELSRRRFFFGAAATLAVIRTPGLLMPVKAIEIEPMVVTRVGASMMWSVPDSAGGYLYSDALSEYLRAAIFPLTKFRQFCDVPNHTPGALISLNPLDNLERISHPHA